MGEGAEVLMTTDNRTNEPSEAQIEAAAKAAYEFDADVSELFGKGFKRDFDGMPQWAKDTHLDKARAALVAAAGAAPQVDSEIYYCPIHGDLLDPMQSRSQRCFNAPDGHEYAALAAPVQPSITVDEGKLTQAIYDELMTDDAVAEVWSNGKVMATARRLVKFAVVEAIGGESRGRS